MLVLLKKTLQAVELKMQSWYLDEEEMRGWETHSSIECVNFFPYIETYCVHECTINEHIMCQ